MFGSELAFEPLLYLTAFILSALLCWSLAPLAPKLRLVDIPGGRKVHEGATPTHGGIAIFLAAGCCLLLSEHTQSVAVLGLMAISTFILLTGALDDAIEIPAKPRLVLQVLAALALIGATDTQITTLGNLFGAGSVELGPLGIPFTVFCFVAGVNAINMLDGIDGLAGSIISVILTALCAAFMMNGNALYFTISAVALASTLGFLLLNFRIGSRQRAKLFMGDSGSNFLGLLLVWLAIKGTQGANAPLAPAFALSLLAVPLIDSGAVLINRIRAKRSPLSPGRDHMHHFLLSCSFSPAQICGLMAAGCVGFITLGLAALELHLGESLLVALFFVTTIAYALFLNHAEAMAPAATLQSNNVLTLKLQSFAEKRRKKLDRNAA